MRGNAGNPGVQEGFFGEVKDILSAYEYLSKLKHINKKQIYLGGHSTGATLVLLVAASTDKFKSIFAFGPVEDPLNYGANYAYHDVKNKLENQLRAPINFVSSIKSPTYIIEGSKGNIGSLLAFKKASKNVPALGFNKY